MDFPVELQERMLDFHKSIENIKSAMKFVSEKSSSETRDELEPLDKAKYDLVCAYVLNSLFWMHLHTKGENPRNHGIKQELERIQGYMTKVKQLMDKTKAPKLDIESSKRILRHSLWTPEHKNQSISALDEVQVIEDPSEAEISRKRDVLATTKEKRSRKKLRQN